MAFDFIGSEERQRVVWGNEIALALHWLIFQVNP